jgi:hypothetical protein
MTERYPDLAGMILLGILLAAIGVLTFYGMRWQWGWNNWIGATSRMMARTFAVIAGIAGLCGACFAIGHFFFNWW